MVTSGWEDEDELGSFFRHLPLLFLFLHPFRFRFCFCFFSYLLSPFFSSLLSIPFCPSVFLFLRPFHRLLHLCIEPQNRICAALCRGEGASN